MFFHILETLRAWLCDNWEQDTRARLFISSDDSFNAFGFTVYSVTLLLGYYDTI